MDSSPKLVRDMSSAAKRDYCPVGAFDGLRAVHIGEESREDASHEATGRPVNRGGPKNGEN